MRQTNRWQPYPVKHSKHLELNRTTPKHWTQDKPSKQMNNSKTSLKFPRSGWCTKKNKTHHEYSATAVKGDRPHNRCLFKALLLILIGGWCFKKTCVYTFLEGQGSHHFHSGPSRSPWQVNALSLKSAAVSINGYPFGGAEMTYHEITKINH